MILEALVGVFWLATGTLAGIGLARAGIAVFRRRPKAPWIPKGANTDHLGPETPMAWVGPPHDRVIAHARECRVCRDHIAWHHRMTEGKRYNNDHHCSVCVGHISTAHGGS